MVNVCFTLVVLITISTCYGCLEEEAQTLLLFKEHLFKTEQEIAMSKTFLTTWKNGTDCCRHWQRVVCNPLTHRVQRLDFHRNLLNSNFSFEIKDWETLLPLSNLHGLTSLDLSGNSMNLSLVLACLGKFPSLSEINLRSSSQYFDSSISSALKEWPTEALQRLTSLNLDENSFSGSLPPQLQNMTSLVYLDLSGNHFNSNFHELRGLSNLRHLLLEGLNAGKVTWSAWNFSRLVGLSLSSCSLEQHHIEQMKWLKLNKDLKYLNLDDNMLTDITFIMGFSRLRAFFASRNSIGGAIPIQIKELKSLQKLDLSSNKLEGTIPNSIGKMLSLQLLALGSNNLEGLIPKSIGNLQGLQRLLLGSNKLKGVIPKSIGNMTRLQILGLASNKLDGRIPSSIGNLSLLTDLDLSNNSLSGCIPSSLSNLSKLTSLHFDYNQLSGSISQLALPSSLKIFSIKANHMEGLVSESMFSNLTKLRVLDITRSGLSMNISKTWIPNFSCEQIMLSSCKINGLFPEWISSQADLVYLDLSNTGLHGQIPSWIWDLPNPHSSAALNLSYNQLEGHVPQLGRFHIADLSFHRFSGPLPPFIAPYDPVRGSHDPYQRALFLYFYFKNNSFEGPLPMDVGVGFPQQIVQLDASNNKLSGSIPRTYSNCIFLEFLNLANNNLNGTLPIGFGKDFQSLKSLTLFNNDLEGTLPESLSGCSELRVLNLGNNRFSGQFPQWITHLHELRILEMRSNRLQGNIPKELEAMPYLHFIDISSNQISGEIPKSISNLPGLIKLQQDYSNEKTYAHALLDTSHYSEIGFDLTAFEEIEFNVKGLYLSYPHIPSALTCIDLSDNLLTGEILKDLDKLEGLKLLNLSRNHLTGLIPASIGNMSGLEELDLSANKLSGAIPNEFVRLYSMGFLNLSYNNLSGRIPREGQMLTFGEQFFRGNPNLIDPLLLLKKRHIQAQTGATSEEQKGYDQTFWWEITVGVSYGVGLALFIGTWSLNGRFRKYVNSSMDHIILWLFRYRY